MNRQYDKYTTIARQIDDCIDGEYAVKSKGKAYLPMLSGMNSIDGEELYSIYIEQAKFFPATGKTQDAFLGTLFRKTPQHNLEESNTDLLTSFTDDGDTAEGCARTITNKLIKNGLCAMLVDFPVVDTTDPLTLRDVEDMQIKPYAVIYDIYQIKEWKYIKRFGRKILKSVMLEEQYEVEDFPYTLPPKAIVVDGIVSLFRELTTDEEGYKQNIYILMKDESNKDSYVKITEIFPFNNGSRLKYIPIVAISNHGLTFEYDYPLLYDLTRVNFCDYRTDALYRNSLYYIGRPTLCVSALKPFEEENGKETVISLGSSTFLEFEQGGNAWMLSGDANSCSALREELTRLKAEMATLGSRTLSGDPKGVESATTAIVHRIGEIGTLSTVAAVVSMAMRRAIFYMLQWKDPGIVLYEEDIEYKIQKDFIPMDKDTNLMNSLFQQYLQGNLPLEVLFYNLSKTEIIPETMTLDTYKEGIKPRTIQPVPTLEPVVQENVTPVLQEDNKE